jgi:hypothetical protein
MGYRKKRRDGGESALSAFLPPAFATIDGWCQISGMSKTRTYDALSTGVLKGKKLAGRTLVDVPHGLQYLRSLPDYPARKAV